MQSFITRIPTFLIVLLYSTSTFGQDLSNDDKISFKDSILLREFWTDFKSAINAYDKAKLATLCQIPFYCSPCTEDTTLEINDHVTIKVTETLFNESQYKLFFDKPIRDEVEKQNGFNINIFFRAYDDKLRPRGFSFSYDINPFSETWKGLQGIIYLDKIK